MHIDWDHVRIRLNCAGRSRWDPGISASKTYHKDEPRTDHTLVHCWAGRGRVVIRSGHTELRAGMCLWMRRGRVYDIRQDPDQPVAMTFIHFDLLDPAGRPLPIETPLPPEIFNPVNPQHVESLTQRITDLLMGRGQGYAWAPKDGPVRRIATMLLTGLLMELDHDAATRPALVGAHRSATKRLRRQVEQIMQLASGLLEEQDRLPTVAQLARQAGYSQSHFSRLFKDVTGHGAQEYLIHARIGRASNLLLHSSMPIGQIAQTLGYGNIFNFSRQFKQRMGVPPTRYRREGGTVWASRRAPPP